ncbi:MAG: UDP-N-acetylmuramate dehydrogenase [Candidatus Saccharimonadales bacterium]
MQITDATPLAQLSTMRLGGQAAHSAVVTTRMELLEALSWAQTNGNLPVIMVGDGSNIVWRDEGFAGLIIINRINRFELFEEDELNCYVTAGSGENWDSVVARTVELGYSGIECLSLIPGTAGATPIQNVGAYGQEISNVLVTIEAFDTQAGDYVTIPASEGGFGYRQSRFNTTDRGRYYITAITMHLTKNNIQPPFYATLQTYLDDHKISSYTPADLRQAVIAIRSSKLPDPAIVNNTGSFFANPIVDQEAIDELQFQYGKLPYWSVGSGSYKLSAAWLIQQSGLKDYHDQETGMATWPAQPLVLVNETAKSTADLLKFKQKIVDAVASKFQVTLIQEPELLPRV